METSKNWDVEPWLETLIQAAMSLRCEPKEKFLIEVALRYLHCEAKTGRLRRNHAAIKRVWLLLHPILERHLMLHPYRTDQTLKERLKFFVNDKF